MIGYWYLYEDGKQYSIIDLAGADEFCLRFWASLHGKLVASGRIQGENRLPRIPAHKTVNNGSRFWSF